MREKLADLCHRQWSGWMEYLFGKCAKNDDGTMTIPKWAVDRWSRQASTDYAHLSKEEQDSDRDEADRFLTLVAEAHPQADNKQSTPLPVCECGEWERGGGVYCPSCGGLRPE